VAPRIVARQNLRLWHRLGAALYVVQWLSAAVVLWPLAGRRERRARMNSPIVEIDAPTGTWPAR
jgi:hypothetical protein